MVVISKQYAENTQARVHKNTVYPSLSSGLSPIAKAGSISKMILISYSSPQEYIRTIPESSTQPFNFIHEVTLCLQATLSHLECIYHMKSSRKYLNIRWTPGRSMNTLSV